MFAKEIDQAIKAKRLYFLGEKLPNDWYEAFRIWLPMAQGGDAKAQYNIGRCYSLGQGTDKDVNLSLEWYKKAAAQNEPRAHCNLYFYYDEIKDSAQAKLWFDKAVALGEPRALDNLAKTLLGEGKNSEAKIKFQQAVDQGYQSALAGLIACDIVLSGWRIQAQKSVTYATGTTTNGTSNYATRKGFDGICTVRNQSAHSAVIKIWLAQFSPKYLHERLGINSTASSLEAGQAQQYKVDLTGVYKDNKPVRSTLVYCTHLAVKINGEDEVTFTLHEKQLVGTKAEGCFVLTACYGDYDAPTVMQYRQFRDNHLAHHPYGKKFIAWYYQHGPKWAAQLEQMPRTKIVFRGVFKTLAHVLPK